MKRAFVLVLVFFLAVGVYSCKQAGPNDGKALFKIKNIAGKDCTVKRTGSAQWTDAKTFEAAKRFLFKGDIVKTGLGTQVVLEMPNGGTCILKPKTQLTVVQPKDGQNEQSISKVILKIIHGTGLFSVNKAPPKYHVTTDHAVTGVLGTKFMVESDGKGSKCSVFEGNVECDDDDDGEDEDKDGDKVVCPAKNTVTINADGTVGKPTPMTIMELKRVTDFIAELNGVKTKPGYNR